MRRLVAADGAARAFALVLAPRDAETIVGDLEEERAVRARSAGPAAAEHWYRSQLIRSWARVAWAAIAGARWPGNWAVAAAGFVAAVGGEAALLSAVEGWIGHGAFEDMIHLAVGSAMLALCGLAVAHLRCGAGLCCAVLAAAAAAVLLIANLGAPSWLQVAFLVLGPAACLVGAASAIPGRRRAAGRPRTDER